MKKILYFIQLPPPIHGVTMVNKQVFESIIINKNFIKKLILINFSKSLLELNKISLKKIFLFINLWCKLFYNLISFKPQYIYYSLPPIGLGFYKELPNLITIKLFGILPIFHLHGKGIEDKIKSTLQKNIYKYIFSNSVVLHLSKGLCNSEFKNIKLKNTRFYPVANGIPIVSIERNRSDNAIIEFLFLSNIQESKGIFLLLEVFNEVFYLYSQARLNIVGNFRDSNTERKFRGFVEKNNIEDRIKLWGHRFDREKHQIIANCDILVHPSFNDTFPLVILEAMQHGLAIIGSDQGAIPEIIKPEFGFVFPTGNKKILFELIKYLILHKEKRDSMRANAKKIFLNNYTLDHFENRMIEIFNQL